MEARGRNLRRHGAGRKMGEIGGSVEIGRFEPALAGAGHAADEDVDGCGGRNGVGEQPGEHARISVMGELAHALVGTARECHRATRIDAPGAQVRRSPVDRDPLRRYAIPSTPSIVRRGHAPAPTLSPFPRRGSSLYGRADG